VVVNAGTIFLLSKSKGHPVAKLEGGYRAASVANAAAGTRDFNDGIAGDGVVAYMVEMVGGGQASDIASFKIYAGSDLLFDCTFAHFLALMQRMTRGRYVPSAADTHFCIPLFNLDVDENDDRRYATQMPVGRVPSISIVTGAGGAGETLVIGWIREKSGIKALAYPAFTEINLGMIAATAKQTKSITKGGLIRALTVPTTGVDRMKLTMASETVFELTGPMLVSCQAADNVPTGGATGRITHPICLELDPPRVAVSAGLVSEVEIDAAAGYPGAAVNMGVYANIPQ
jgi:hypothetical protein